MKKFTALFYIIISAAFTTIHAQDVLTIDECYALAKNNYPLLKQMSVIERSKEYSLDNAAKGYLPQINFSGQATYQSDVTKIPVNIPNVNVPVLNKDQYKIYTELSQSLTDPYNIKRQKELIQANASIEREQLETELYKLKERINQVYFGILLIDAQLVQNTILKKDIQAGIDKATAGIANGVALKSSADVLKAELLKAEQRAIELKAGRKGYTDMLTVFINKPVDENSKLQMPVSQVMGTGINRPELKWYEAQKKSIVIQNKLITARNIPKANLFIQGGYANPALNFLKNGFEFYYIGGLRLNWNLSGLYTAKKERQQLRLNQAAIDIQKEAFLFNNNILLKQQGSEINKFKELIDTDNQIILLRERIKSTANSQLEFGTISANDFVSYVNAEDQARQSLLLHQVQLLMTQYTYQSTSGN